MKRAEENMILNASNHSRASIKVFLDVEDESFVPMQRDEQLAKYEIMALSIIFSCIIVGNLICIWAIVCQKRHTKRISFFILNLCIADLIVAFFNVLPQLAWKVTFEWRGGLILCKFIPYTQVFSMYLTTYVLLATAFDRYVAICKPLQMSLRTFRMAKRCIITAWSLALFFAIPQFFIFDLKTISKPIKGISGNFQTLFHASNISLKDFGLCEEHYQCRATHPYAWSETAYMTWFLAAIYIIPLAIMIYLYTSICIKIYCIIKQHGLDANFVIDNSNRNANLVSNDKEAHGLLNVENTQKAHTSSSTPNTLILINDIDIELSSFPTSFYIKPEISKNPFNMMSYMRHKHRGTMQICKTPGEIERSYNRVSPKTMFSRSSEAFVELPSPCTLSLTGSNKGFNHGKTFMSTKSLPKPRCRTHYLKRQNITRAKVKTIQLTLCVVVCYILCWSPFFISLFYINIMKGEADLGKSIVICILLGNLTSCINPWIYISFNANLIKEVLALKTYHANARSQGKNSYDNIVTEKSSQFARAHGLNNR